MLRLKKGQTLVEVVVASSILAVIAALAAVITARVYTSYEVIKAQNEARKTVEEALNVICYRYNGNNQGLIDATAITEISVANEITFTAQDGTTAIRYYYDSDEDKIDKEVDTGAGFEDSNDIYISDDVVINNFQLVYLDNFGAVTATESEVTQIKITITAWFYIGGATSGDYRVLTVHTSVRPLNLYTL